MALLDPPRRCGRLFTASPSMGAIVDRLEELAPSEASVLIEGETGTGKELVAEAIHEHSRRAAGPYMVVDCAAVPGELIESELFGHARGAFTGAVADRAGAFEAAGGGTLFIDELGELPLELQPRLLRVLEKREVRRVGTNTPRAVDVRVVAATNRDLWREVSEGRFREDLYFRLAVVKLKLPPLRERPEDVVLLAQRFLAELPEPLTLPDEARAQLLAHPWPGNVRELRNTIDRGAALSDRVFRLPEDFGQSIALDGWDGAAPGSGVGLEAAPEEDASEVAPLASHPAGALTRPLWEGRSFKEAREAVLEDFERGYLTALLEAHGGNVSAAARAAGIHRNILHRMMARHGLGR